jgi:hypothetical protein
MRFTSEVSFDLKGDKQLAASYIPFVRTLIKIVENVFTTKGLGASEIFTFRREIAPGVEVSIFYGAPYPSVTITAAPGGGEKQEPIEYLVRPLWEPEGFLVSYPGANVSLFASSYDTIHYHARYEHYNHTPYAWPGIIPFPPCAIINRYKNNKYGDKLVKDGKILPLLDKPYLVSWLPLIHAEYTEKNRTDGPGIYRRVKFATSEGIKSKFVRLVSDKYSLPKEEETDTWFLHEPEVYTPPVHSFQVLLDLINELRQQVGTAENDPDKARPLSFSFRGHGDLAYVICDEIVRSGVFSHDPGYRDPYKNVLGRSFIDLTVFPSYNVVVLGENIALAPGSVKSDDSARTVFEGWKASPGHFRVMTDGDYASRPFDYNLGQGPRYNPAAHIFGRFNASSETIGSGMHGVSEGGGLYDVPEGEKVSGHVWALDIRAQHSFAVAGDLIVWEDAEGSERITMRPYAPTVFFDLDIRWRHVAEGVKRIFVWKQDSLGHWFAIGQTLLYSGAVYDLYLSYSSFFYKGRAIPVPGQLLFGGNTPYAVLGAGRRKTGQNPGFYAVVVVREQQRSSDHMSYMVRYYILYLPDHANPWTGWRVVHNFSNPANIYVESVSHVYFNASCTKFVFGFRSQYGDGDPKLGWNYWYECDFASTSPLVTLLSQEFVDEKIDDSYENFNGTRIVRYGYIGDNLVYSYLRINVSFSGQIVDVEYDVDGRDIVSRTYTRNKSISWVLHPAVGPPLVLADYTLHLLIKEVAFPHGVYWYEEANASGFVSDFYYTNYLYGPTFVRRRNVVESGPVVYPIPVVTPWLSPAVRLVYDMEFHYYDGIGGLEKVWSTTVTFDDFYLVFNRTEFPYRLTKYFSTLNDFPVKFAPYTQVCLKYKNEHFSGLVIKTMFLSEPLDIPDGLAAGLPYSIPPIIRSSLPSSLIEGRFPLGII